MRDLTKIGTVAKSIFTCMSFLMTQNNGYACTTFSYIDVSGPFVAKSYDWHQEDGLVYVNKRGVLKRSIKVFPDDQVTSWTSKYGSVTFNQYGRELPNGGINEAGVVVEVMEFTSSQFEQPGSKPSINESQWVQYMLDNASSVQELKTLAANIRISKILVPLHYMACDTSGACATIEYLNGHLAISDLSDRRTKVLTNNSYPDSLAYLGTFEGFGGKTPPPTGPSSLDRFVRAAYFLDTSSPKEQVDPRIKGFKGLDTVRTSITQWNIVYDVQGKKVAFNSKTTPSIKWIDMKAFDFNCLAPVLAFPLVSHEAGDVTHRLTPYSYEQNADLVRRSLSGGVPEELIVAASRLPESTSCAN